MNGKSRKEWAEKQYAKAPNGTKAIIDKGVQILKNEGKNKCNDYLNEICNKHKLKMVDVIVIADIIRILAKSED